MSVIFSSIPEITTNSLLTMPIIPPEDAVPTFPVNKILYILGSYEKLYNASRIFNLTCRFFEYYTGCCVEIINKFINLNCFTIENINIEMFLHLRSIEWFIMGIFYPLADIINYINTIIDSTNINHVIFCYKKITIAENSIIEYINRITKCTKNVKFPLELIRLFRKLINSPTCENYDYIIDIEDGDDEEDEVEYEICTIDGFYDKDFTTQIFYYFNNSTYEEDQTLISINELDGLLNNGEFCDMYDLENNNGSDYIERDAINDMANNNHLLNNNDNQHALKFLTNDSSQLTNMNSITNIHIFDTNNFSNMMNLQNIKCILELIEYLKINIRDLKINNNDEFNVELLQFILDYSMNSLLNISTSYVNLTDISVKMAKISNDLTDENDIKPFGDYYEDYNNAKINREFYEDFINNGSPVLK
jgi:hypothetical protein